MSSETNTGTATSRPLNPIVARILGKVRPSKSVLCCILAFLEALWEDLETQPVSPTPLADLVQSEVKPNGIVSQDTRVKNHLKRFDLPTANYEEGKSGRKTPHAKDVVPPLVEHLQAEGWETGDPAQREALIRTISTLFQEPLGLSLGPMKVSVPGKSAAAVVEEILREAEDRGVMSAIAELLVGCKLEICLPDPHRSKIRDQHKWENGHDDPDALGDYRLENVAIEVTMVKNPDSVHRSKANRITSQGTDECWLIVRSGLIKEWQEHLAAVPSRYPGLIRCFGVCEFIGQNLTETRWRSHDGTSNPLVDVVNRLNALVAEKGSQFLPAARVDLAFH